MFFGDGASSRKVTLRGSSKQQDRQSVLDRAAREREVRQEQRVRQRSATLLQSAFRRRVACKALSARERAGWDVRMRQALSAGATFAVVPAIDGLVRALLVFDGSTPADASDAPRRSALCELLLANAAATDACVNRCAAMLAAEAAPAGSCEANRATAWLVQSRHLVRLCLRAIASAPTPAVAASELRLVAYLTDSAAWLWLSALPSPAHVQRAVRAGHELALSAGSDGGWIHELAWGRLDSAGTALLALEPSSVALSLVSLRAVCAPIALGLGPAAPSSKAQARRFARAALSIPALVSRLPPPLAAALLADRQLVASLLETIGADEEASPMPVRRHRRASATGPSPQRLQLRRQARPSPPLHLRARGSRLSRPWPCSAM
ncbi:hypothetical protein T492DRAFT_841655 [Pavlovales sp. CCMP2436]|nr:hypothetical protein T492DRAFT_841655 [Pavlovales sp. CCMP2436]